MAKKSWYAMQASVRDGKPVAEIRIYDEIGYWGVTAKQFLNELDAVIDGAERVVVSINSPGGDVFEAFAIFNALKRCSLPVTTRVDGIAASAASLILMAGEEIVMPENAMVMIHNAWTIAVGTADELRATADMMDKVRDGIAAAYAGKSGQDTEKIIELMDATTWLTALEAQALGFCDVIEEPVKLAASSDMASLLARHKDVPDGLLATLIEPEDPVDGPVASPDPAPEQPPDPGPTNAMTPSALSAHIFSACREQGIPGLAEGVLASGGLESRRHADVRISAASEIAGLCLAAKLPDTAADYVTAGLGVEQVRARLFDRVVQDSAGAISNIQRPQEGGPAASGPSARSIYAGRRAANSTKT